MEARKREVHLKIANRLDGGTISFGCRSCIDFSICGGHTRRGGGWRCFDVCSSDGCGKEECDVVCYHNPERLALARAEVGGFSGSDIDSLSCPDTSEWPSYIGGIGHKYLEGHIPFGWAVIPVREVIRLRKDRWEPRFKNGALMRKSFGLDNTAKVILNCIDRDEIIELIWHNACADLFGHIADLNFIAAIPPNFSVFNNEPRLQHLYNRKRSLIVAESLSAFGIPVIPYFHGTSPGDSEFWGSLLKEREDITCFAQEFQTDRKRPESGLQCLRELASVVNSQGRIIHLVAVGGYQYADYIADNFVSWTITSYKPFMMAMFRHRALVNEAGKILEIPDGGQPKDLLLHNHNEIATRCFSLALTKARLRGPEEQ